MPWTGRGGGGNPRMTDGPAVTGAAQRWGNHSAHYGAAYNAEIFLVRITSDQKIPEFHVVLGQCLQNRVVPCTECG